MNFTAIFRIFSILFFAITGAASAQSAHSGNHAHGNAERNPGNGNNTVAICHQTGNGSITIYVAPAAVAAHLAHGDYLGECIATPPNDDDSDDEGNDEGNDDSNDEGNDDSNDEGNNETENNEPPVSGGCSPVQVMSYIPGTTNDLLSPIEAARMDPTKALFTPQDSDVSTSSANYNFVALGFGGEITLKFANPIKNGEGDDIYVVETTFGSMAQNCQRYPEKVRAFASQDNCNWVYLGEGCQNTYFDLGILNWAQYVKLVDVSDITQPFNNGLADGYDVDGIICLHGEETNPIPAALSNMFASQVVAFSQGTLKNGGSVAASRSNPANALGAPQQTDMVNFVSLGFGGQLTLGFDYVVYNKAGADIRIVETSYGNPSCTNYPETARIEISMDGEMWYNVDGEYCLDQDIDVASAGIDAFRFIRITDASPMSSNRFPGNADGYDVDGVVVLQPGCSNSEASTARIADNTTTPDEVAEISLYPNPFNESAQIKLSPASTATTYAIQVSNTLGQVVQRETLTVGANQVSTFTLNTKNLDAGTYMISVQNGAEIQTLRAVKF